ncbi:MAG: sulfite exporter TauE/SafE family protein [Gemmatimonadota bacterium]
MSPLGLILGLSIGLSLGLLGGGGSILTVPILVYVLHYGVKPAVPMSLAVVGATSAVGAIAHARNRNINLRAALAFGPVGMVGSFLGSRVAAHFSAEAQLILFAIVMLAASGFMLRSSFRKTGGTEAPESRMTHPALVALIGAAVGTLTGILGVGGGFLIVPALVLLAGIPMREAVGTSLLVIAMTSAAGVAGYAGRMTIEWSELTLFTIVACAGVVIGASLVRYVPQQALRRAFAVFLIVVGVFILLRPRPTADHIQAVQTR